MLRFPPPFTSQILFAVPSFWHFSVQWFTSAVDKRDARCLLQPAINCLVWHWVSMILSTGAHIARYIKHTHMHKLTTHAHTHHTEMEPTWVVKLAACISGIDLFGIEPCHCCHLNFGLGTSPNRPPCHHTPPPSIASSVPSSSEWKMDGTPTTDCSTSMWSCLPLPINTEQTSYDSLAKCLEKKKKTVLSHFCKCSPLISSSSPLWNISLLLKPKPTGAKSQWSLLLKLPSYQTKYRQDIASQMEW